MLKIKDDVDLKELEKFGFKPKYDEDTGEITRYVCKKNIYKFTNGMKEKTTELETIEIKHIETIKDYGDFFKQKEISYWEIKQLEFDTTDIIYDLIKADLVEKVGD